MTVAEKKAWAIGQNRIRDRLEAPGLRAARAMAIRIRQAVLSAYSAGRDPSAGLLALWRAWTDRLSGIMVMSDLQGRLVTLERMDRRRTLRRGDLFSLDTVTAFARERFGMTPADVGLLRDTYLPRAQAEVAKGARRVESALRAGMEKIIVEGQHVRSGVKTLRAALDSVGVGVGGEGALVQPYMLETMVRSETAIAYIAGRQRMLDDPDLAGLVWGYEYVTVGDDRVRPEHAGLDGVTLPIDDPRWARIMPPNSFNCRCDVLEVLSEDAPKNGVPPPGEFKYEYADGRVVTVEPGPDPGWDFNPRDL